MKLEDYSHFMQEIIKSKKHVIKYTLIDQRIIHYKFSREMEFVKPNNIKYEIERILGDDDVTFVLTLFFKTVEESLNFFNWQNGIRP